MAKTVYVLNGPNLNLLGTREPKTYGRATLREVEKLCREAARRHKLEVECRQSNHEGEIVDLIHEAAAKKAAGSSSMRAAIPTRRSRSATRLPRSRCP
jgi:3-dehydroquinate dehydratase-2